MGVPSQPRINGTVGAKMWRRKPHQYSRKSGLLLQCCKQQLIWIEGCTSSAVKTMYELFYIVQGSVFLGHLIKKQRLVPTDTQRAM